MGVGTLNAAVDGTPIPANDHNEFVDAMTGDIVPRDATTLAPTDNAASLGQSSYRFKRANITTGYWECGDVKFHHSYNDAVPVGEGWMKCDGRIVSQTNYDTEHGAGHWATYIVSSPLNGKYLPNFTKNNGVYPVGAASTTQDGSVALTTVGNASHQVSLSHTHDMSHDHEWFRKNVGGSEEVYTQLSGVRSIPANSGVATSNATIALNTAGVTFNIDDNLRTDSLLGNTGSGGSSTQNIQPESFAVQVYMRVI